MVASIQPSQVGTAAFAALAINKAKGDDSGALGKLRERLEAGAGDNISGDDVYSAGEKAELQKLNRRDRGVHRHEMMHRIYAGGNARGNITYTYEVGPDGKRYAVHGEVSVDASPAPGGPEATIEKMRAIRRAATAPTDPSSADLRAAMMAQRMETSARLKLQKEAAEEARQEEREQEFDEMDQPVETDRRLMNADQAVNLFRSTIRPELVSNLFDTFA